MAGGRRTLVPRLLVLLLVVFAVYRGQEAKDGARTSEAKKKKSKHKFCPSTKCADLATEVERWGT